MNEFIASMTQADMLSEQHVSMLLILGEYIDIEILLATVVAF